MNEVLRNIYERRSVRSYTEEAVPEEILREIIKAGFHAPNGKNVQGLRFVVITNKAKLSSLAGKAKAMSLGYWRKVDQEHPGGAAGSLLKMLENPQYDIFFGAPALVMVFASPLCLTPVEDASLAAGNMMLAAHSFGLGSCWIGFASPLQSDSVIMNELNIPEGHKLIAPIVFGYPKKSDMRPSTRVEPPVLAWLR
jgi:nitroreductase